MHRYHSATIRSAGGGINEPGQDLTATLGVYGSGQYVVWSGPGEYRFRVPVTGWYRGRVVGAGASGGNASLNPPDQAGKAGGSSSIGTWISATGGGTSDPGVGIGGDFRAAGGRGGATVGTSGGGGGGGGSAGSFLGDGYNGGSGAGTLGGGGGGVGGNGSVPDEVKGTHGGHGGGSASNATQTMPGTGFQGLRDSRFPTDILAGAGGFGALAGTNAADEKSNGGPGAGGGGSGQNYPTTHGISGGGGVLGGGGGASSGDSGGNGGPGGAGGGGGGSNGLSGGTGLHGGHGGGWAHGEKQFIAGDVVIITVGAGGESGSSTTGPGGDGLVVLEW